MSTNLQVGWGRSAQITQKRCTKTAMRLKRYLVVCSAVGSGATVKCSPPRRHRTLSLERLDARDCPAGSVSATVANSVLSIIGDSKNNVVTVWKGENAGQLVIAGCKDPSGAPT